MENLNVLVLSTLWKEFQFNKAIKSHKKKRSSEFGVEELDSSAQTSDLSPTQYL